MVIDMKMSEEEMENLFENIWIKRLDMNEIVEASERDWIATLIRRERVRLSGVVLVPHPRVSSCVCAYLCRVEG